MTAKLVSYLCTRREEAPPLLANVLVIFNIFFSLVLKSPQWLD
jgi:hypothetical protein